MKIENIDTEIGNKVLEQLRKDSWKVSNQYSRFAFYKGIDFDSDTLKKSNEKLYFEWTNWFEWEIQGNKSEIGHLIARLNLSE